MRALISGASGFLGRHLRASLEAHGHEVHALDSRTAPFLAPEHLERRLGGLSFDRIYHCAVLTRAGDFCAKNGGRQWLTNQKLDTNMLEWWSARQPGARLIAFGTSASYAPGEPLREDRYLEGQPVADYRAYAMSKRMLLTGLRALAGQYGLAFHYVIPSTLYGPDYHVDDRRRHFIYDIIAKALRARREGGAIELLGDGTTERELLHVRDFLAGVERAAAGPANEIYNLGAGVGHPIREFARLVCAELGYDFANVRFGSAPAVGLPSKVLDIGKARRELGFAPAVTLAEGLRETVRWCERAGWG